MISFECPDDICKERFLTRSYQDRKDDESMFAFRIEEYHANTPGIVKELSDTHQCNIVKVGWEKGAITPENTADSPAGRHKRHRK